MFYNSENLYDSENDSLTQDDEFTPGGDRRWNYYRLKAKANRLSKVIIAAGKWNTPVVVGLCEIESYKVLEVLVKQTPLRNQRLKFIHKDSPDTRGIDVALVYRPDLFKPFKYKAIPVTDPVNSKFLTRDILQVSGILNDCDTIHFFVNHWPSRYGGLMETVRYRKLAAEVLKKSIHELYAIYPKAKIICMGDFNDTPEDMSLSKVLQAEKTDHPTIKGELINLSFPWMSHSIQTLKNLYSWQVFDQWIVSDYLMNNSNCLKSMNAEIFTAFFLLEADKKFGGVKPKRTYVGFKYQEGFSDHLPVLLKLQMSTH
ncbi:MAG TPA: endonuclease [Prolixibacteraceae bacterium]